MTRQNMMVVARDNEYLKLCLAMAFFGSDGADALAQIEIPKGRVEAHHVNMYCV